MINGLRKTIKHRVYNPNKGNTSLHQNSKSWNQKTNAKTLRKAKKAAKGDIVAFWSGFLCGLSLPLRAFALNTYNLCLGYKSDNFNVQTKSGGFLTQWLNDAMIKRSRIPCCVRGQTHFLNQILESHSPKLVSLITPRPLPPVRFSHSSYRGHRESIESLCLLWVLCDSVVKDGWVPSLLLITDSP